MHQTMGLVYAKYKPYTVLGVCRELVELGYGHTSITIEGYDNRRTWTFDTLRTSNYILHPRIGTYVAVNALKADNLLVQWTGGPPRDRQIFTGSLLMCIIDFMLYEAAVNNEINDAIQEIQAVRPAELAK